MGDSKLSNASSLKSGNNKAFKSQKTNGADGGKDMQMDGRTTSIVFDLLFFIL